MLRGAHIKFGSYFRSHVKHFCIMQLYITIVGCLPDKQSSLFFGTSRPYNNCTLGGWPDCPTANGTLSIHMGRTRGDGTAWAWGWWVGTAWAWALGHTRVVLSGYMVGQLVPEIGVVFPGYMLAQLEHDFFLVPSSFYASNHLQLIFLCHLIHILILILLLR